MRIANPELNEKIELAYPSSITPFGAQRTLRVGRGRVGGLQIPSRTPVGEPRASAPTRRATPLGEAA